MKKSLLILSLLFIVFFTSAQTFEWLVTEEIDYLYNPGMIHYATTTDQEENSYLFGIKEHVDFYNKSYGTLLLHKYDGEGALLWSKQIDGLASACGMQTNTTGDIYIIGSFRADLDFWEEGSLYYSGTTEMGFLAKVQSDGTFSWALNFSDLYESPSIPADIVVDSDEQVYVGHVGWPDSYISVFDEDGELVMDIYQSEAGLISGIDVGAEGNVFAAGSCSGSASLFGGVSYITPFTYSMFLAMYDNTGAPLWVEFIEDLTCPDPAVRVAGDGSIYMSGPLQYASAFGNLQAEGPSWVFDFFITRLSPDGEFEWIVEVPQVFTGDVGTGLLNHIDVNSEGNVVFGGVTRGSIDWGNEMVSYANLYYDVFLTEISSTGEMQWVKTAGGEYYDQVHSVSVSPSGNLFLCGMAGDTVTFDTIVHSSEAFSYPFLAKVDMGFATAIINPMKNDQDLTVFPNPVRSGTINLTFPNSTLYQELDLKCFNIQGELIHSGQKKAQQQELRVDVQHWQPGIYLATIYAGGLPHSTARFVVQ